LELRASAHASTIATMSDDRWTEHDIDSKNKLHAIELEVDGDSFLGEVAAELARRNEAPKGIEASLQAIVNEVAAKVAPDLAPPKVTWKLSTPLRDLLNNAELPAPQELPEHIQRLFFGPRQETADLRITGVLDTRASLTIGPLTVFDDGTLRIAEGVEPCDVMRLMKRAIEEATKIAKKA
jgi:hypothetical protein